MSQESRSTLKQLFENGDLMTQDSFNKLIDSFYNFSDDDDVSIVNLYTDLPASPIEPDLKLAYVRDSVDDTGSNVPALYIYDNSSWNLITRIDGVVYTTTLNDATTSPGIDIPNGTTVADLKGISFSQFIDTYVFPTVDASITSNESAVLTFSPASGTVEVGTTLNKTLTATFNRGQIQNGDGSNGPTLVGSPSSFVFTGPGIATNVTVNSSNLVEAINTGFAGYDQVEALFGNNIWNVVVNYDGGVGDYTDSKGNVQNQLDGSRIAGFESDDSTAIVGRYYVFFDTGSIPVDSAGVRGATNKQFLSGTNTGSFNITIPQNTPQVFFAVPTGKSIQVNYVESANADVTGTFSSSTFNVNDAGNNPVSYDIWSSTIGGGGYPSQATYSVVIS